MSEKGWKSGQPTPCHHDRQKHRPSPVTTVTRFLSTIFLLMSTSDVVERDVTSPHGGVTRGHRPSSGRSRAGTTMPTQWSMLRCSKLLSPHQSPLWRNASIRARENTWKPQQRVGQLTNSRELLQRKAHTWKNCLEVLVKQPLFWTNIRHEVWTERA